METANILLSQIQDIKFHQKQVRQNQRPPEPQVTPPASQPPLDTMVNDFNRVDLSAGRNSTEVLPYQEHRDALYSSHVPQPQGTPKPAHGQTYPDPRTDPRAAGYPSPTPVAHRRSEEKPPDLVCAQTAPSYATDQWQFRCRHHTEGPVLQLGRIRIRRLVGGTPLAQEPLSHLPGHLREGKLVSMTSTSLLCLERETLARSCLPKRSERIICLPSKY